MEVSREAWNKDAPRMFDWLADIYLWSKSLHVIAIITWMALDRHSWTVDGKAGRLVDDDRLAIHVIFKG